MDSGLTVQELQAFHTIDRTIYTRLVIGVGLHHRESKKVIAFWNWLERIGYYDFVFRLLSTSDSSFRTLTREAITCLYFLNEQGLRPPFSIVDKEIPLMVRLFSPDFSFTFLYENRLNAISKMEEFVQNVCEIAFSDMVPPNLTNVRPYFQPQSSNRREEFHSQAMASVLPRYTTLLLTGYMGQEELKDLIARTIGIEAVYMEDQPQMQPVTARVVFRSPSDVEGILGGKKTAKFSVDGKDVWVRRIV